MNILKEFLIDEIIKYKTMKQDLENSLDMDAEDFEHVVLFDGIAEGLAIALQKVNESESKETH